jgi:hypothetical protein
MFNDYGIYICDELFSNYIVAMYCLCISNTSNQGRNFCILNKVKNEQSSIIFIYYYYHYTPIYKL